MTAELRPMDLALITYGLAAGAGPSVAEVAEDLDVWPTQVEWSARQLEQAGLLRVEGRRRALRATDRGRTVRELAIERRRLERRHGGRIPDLAELVRGVSPAASTWGAEVVRRARDQARPRATALVLLQVLRRRPYRAAPPLVEVDQRASDLVHLVRVLRELDVASTWRLAEVLRWPRRYVRRHLHELEQVSIVYRAHRVPVLWRLSAARGSSP